MPLAVGCQNSGYDRPFDYVYDTESDDEGKQAKEPVADTESDSDDATSKTQVKDAKVGAAEGDKNTNAYDGAKEPVADTESDSDDDGKAEPKDAPISACVDIYPNTANRKSLRATSMRTRSSAGDKPYKLKRPYKRTKRA